ncbi:MAG TPA: hypothetical protein VMC79_04095 [Rectinemataceae bacterium]|nr:hypothetical protein [Rectinemataceae bacterium]
METSAVLHIALSFVIAGTWISLSTMAGERLGTRLGGLVTNLPSNILISLLFMALTRGSGYAAAATGSVPIGMSVDTLFLLVLIAFLPRGTGISLALALLAWLVGATAAIALPPIGFGAGIALYAVMCIAAFLVVDQGFKVRVVPKKALPFRVSTVVLRALFAGGIVASAVAAAQYAPPYVTGILATFPAVLLSTMVILIRAQGPDFARATGKVLLISSSNIIIYSIGVWFLFPPLGPWLGTLSSFAMAALYISLFLPFMRRIR